VPEGRRPLGERDKTIEGRTGHRRTTISAQTRSSASFAASVVMRKPIPVVGDPKNSATIAPISASGALTLSAVKMKGSAAGRRSIHSAWACVAA
jgi:hypothetical protein